MDSTMRDIMNDDTPLKRLKALVPPTRTQRDALEQATDDQPRALAYHYGMDPYDDGSDDVVNRPWWRRIAWHLGFGILVLNIVWGTRASADERAERAAQIMAALQSTANFTNRPAPVPSGPTVVGVFPGRDRNATSSLDFTPRVSDCCYPRWYGAGLLGWQPYFGGGFIGTPLVDHRGDQGLRRRAPGRGDSRPDGVRPSAQHGRRNR